MYIPPLALGIPPWLRTPDLDTPYWWTLLMTNRNASISELTYASLQTKIITHIVQNKKSCATKCQSLSKEQCFSKYANNSGMKARIIKGDVKENSIIPFPPSPMLSPKSATIKIDFNAFYCCYRRSRNRVNLLLNTLEINWRLISPQAWWGASNSCICPGRIGNNTSLDDLGPFVK